ncbi:MAG: hypothetical protein ACKO8O_12455, partial [Betaproteobacteria bacterium]
LFFALDDCNGPHLIVSDGFFSAGDEGFVDMRLGPRARAYGQGVPGPGSGVSVPRFVVLGLSLFARFIALGATKDGNHDA